MDIKLAIPVSGVFTKTFLFGEAPNWYVNQFKEPHNGIDYAVPIGTPIVACDNGILAWADNVPDADGCGIILSHSWGRSIYWHTSENLAKYGTPIAKGELIGKSGATGYATGPHLHFGIQLNNPTLPNIRGYVDPQPYFEENVPAPQPPAPLNKIYIVRPGDTLSGIAKKFYGDPALWRRIWDVNIEKIKNPNLIYPLQILKIP